MGVAEILKMAVMKVLSLFELMVKHDPRAVQTFGTEGDSMNVAEFQDASSPYTFQSWMQTRWCGRLTLASSSTRPFVAPSCSSFSWTRKDKENIESKKNAVAAVYKRLTS